VELEVQKNMKRILVGLLLASAAFGGPPLICQRIEIGKAKSLPWKNGEAWAGQDPSYDVKRLTADTLALLVPGTSMPARMETMRRAAIYAVRDPQLAEEIALRLTARVLDADSPDAITLFDAGYFVETVRQAALVYQYNMLTPAEKANWKIHVGIPGLDGKKWVARAVRMGGKGMDQALAWMAD
jgi:hypothetical protein